MATSQPSEVTQHLRTMMLLRDGAGLTDRQLLADYISRRDEAALAALVRRHAPMVWGVCRRMLRNYHDAEDAFQAAFLVFARKATSIASPELLANWLYGVAYQTALNARTTAARRRARERQVAEMPEPEAVQQDLWHDLQPLLDQELSRLPDKYRIPVVLCDLEGKTRKEAAQQIGCPEGTVAGRLARARVLLARRLARHGLAVSGGTLAAVLAPNAALASAPTAVVLRTIKAAGLSAAEQAAATGLIPAKVAALTQGVLKSMLLTKLKIATAVLLAVAGLLVAGLGALALPAPAQKPAAEKEDKEPDKSPAEEKGDKEPDKDPAAGKQIAAELVKPGAKSVRSLAYSNDGNPVALVLSKNEDPGIPGSVVLDVQKGKVQHTLEGFETGRPSPSRPMFFNATASKDGTVIAVASAKWSHKWEGLIKVWDPRTGTLVKSFELDGQAAAVALSADGAKVIGAARTFPTANGKMLVWDVKRGELLQTLEAKGLEYYAAAISDDGKWIAGAGDVGDPTYEGKVVVWEVETGKVKHEWAGLRTMYAVAFSPEGKQVAAAGWVCDAFAISPDGKPVATAGPGPGAAARPDDKVIRVWDVQTGKLKHKLKPEGGVRITGLVFSPDGETLATADFNGSVCLWDLAKEKTRVTLEGHGGSAWCVAFSPDGRTLASGGDDWTIRFWPVAAEPKK
jgi:RNA polymerase sigma factor (sigma-70 family)